ncbi:MAG: DUF202 domain-containing protein [Candidatus Obscuribacterales bacterium]|nr:DUF202 domain-containing protein [Candidatus Obscuribacterales bacterium]
MFCHFAYPGWKRFKDITASGAYVVMVIGSSVTNRRVGTMDEEFLSLPPEENKRVAIKSQETTELARYRTRAAADRSMLAWIRTSLSLIGFGFGIPTLAHALEQTKLGQNINPAHFSALVGLSFITIGVFGAAAALKEHRLTLSQIKSGNYSYEDSHVTEYTGIALILVGLLTFVGVLLRTLL